MEKNAMPKKKYESPEMEVILLDQANVITTSEEGETPKDPLGED